MHLVPQMVEAHYHLVAPLEAFGQVDLVALFDQINLAEAFAHFDTYVDHYFVPYHLEASFGFDNFGTYVGHYLAPYHLEASFDYFHPSYVGPYAY